MALFHRATITPSKAELVGTWAKTQSWCPQTSEAPQVVGAFRFNDPDGEVGIETHLLTAGGTLMQVPVTYRNGPLPGAESSLIGPMEHSVLGTRYVYDGLGDDLYLTMLAAVAMTGQGEALGMAVYDGRWYIAPSNVRLEGGGWSLDRVPVDEFRHHSTKDSKVTLRNDGFDLTFFRQPQATTSRPPMGLTARLDGQPDPVLLARVQSLNEQQ